MGHVCISIAPSQPVDSRLADASAPALNYPLLILLHSALTSSTNPSILNSIIQEMSSRGGKLAPEVNRYVAMRALSLSSQWSSPRGTKLVDLETPRKSVPGLANSVIQSSVRQELEVLSIE